MSPGLPSNASNRLRGDRGQSLAELAIVLPVLMAIVIGIFEFGRAWNVRQTVTHTAREAARLAVIRTSTGTGVDDVIDDRLTAAALDPGQASVTVTGMGGLPGTATTIEVSYPYTFSFLGPVIDLLNGDGEIGGTLTLTSSATMRNE
ncbi:MAG TPA: TadE/TadG family type IV pilus assembly protein [Gemmatimonadota bacterium]|nr:TadE/TadG family type IV pilus assembly protein [Gemmatimonadota bacterium]